MPAGGRIRQGVSTPSALVGEGRGGGAGSCGTAVPLGSTATPDPAPAEPHPSEGSAIQKNDRTQRPPTSVGEEEKRAPDDPYGWIERFAADLHVTARDLVRDSEASRVSDEAVARIMTAAIRLYVAKTDGEERTFRPIVRDDNEPLTATELLSAVSELLRALRLGPMELALWYRRRPDEP